MATLSIMTLADWLTLLGPCALLFLLAYWWTRRRSASGQSQKSWNTLDNWPAKVLYLGRLIAFAVISLLTISMTIMIYRSWLTAQMFIEPANSAVAEPDEFSFSLIPVEFFTEGELVLRGWLIEPQIPGTVILLHGYGSDRTSMLWHAERLAEVGLGVLLYDERASGLSDGTQRSYGWQDPADVAAALTFLEAHHSTSGNSFGIAGCSIGGQIALQAASRDLRLKAVWADGPAVVRAADLPAPNNGLSLLNTVSSYLLDWIMAARLRTLPPPALVKQLPRLAGRPVQLVSGGRAINALGPESRLTARFVGPAGPHADLWIINEAVHCDGPTIAPLDYSARLQQFFQQALIE